MNADLTAGSVFEELACNKVDAFLALGDDDENMLTCALAKRHGIPMILTMTHRTTLTPLLEDLGVTASFNPCTSALEDIMHFISDADFERVSSLGGSNLELVRVRIGKKSPLAEKPLRQVPPDSGLVIAVVEDDSENGHVPKPDDILYAGRHVLVACETGREKQLRKMFDAE